MSMREKKGLFLLPFAFVAYTFIVIIGFLLSILVQISPSHFAIPITYNDLESNTDFFTYADAFSLFECKTGRISATDIIDEYLKQGKTSPDEIVSVKKNGIVQTVSLKECADSFFNPYKQKIALGESKSIILDYGLEIFSAHCQTNNKCLSFGNTKTESITSDIAFHTPFDDFAIMRVYVVLS